MHTTTDRAALLAAVLADPDDDGARLVYADLLEEQGEQARSEFIRLGCHPKRRDGAMRWVEAGLALLEPATYEPWRVDVRRACELLRQWAFFGWAGDALPDEVIAQCVWRRGFVEAVTCTAGDWLAHADALLAAHPVTEVTLTTWPEMPFRGDSFPDGAEMLFVRIDGRECELEITSEMILAQTWAQMRPAVARNLLESEFPRVRTWHLPDGA